MNRFIKARNKCINNYHLDNDCSFNKYYLLNNGNYELFEQNDLLKNIAETKSEQHLNNSSEDDLILRLEQLGLNPYLNRAIIDLLIISRKNRKLETLDQKIKEKLLTENQNLVILYHLLDYCIETREELLNVRQLETLFHTYNHDYDIMKQLVDYVDTFRYEGLEELLEGLLNEPYFENLKLLVIDTLIKLQCSRKSHATVINRLMNLVANEKNPQVFKDYFDYRLEQFPISHDPDKMTIVQTMFYGDPFSLGMGNSGGLGLLLKNLGNSLAENIEIEKIITLTASRKLDFGWKLMEKAAPNHYVFRMPLDLDSSNPGDFATKELMIKRTIKKHLRCLGIKPDIFHIRYLDNASLAVAKAASELNSKIVFTLTPDPHRNMVEKTGSLKIFNPDETLTLINKISVGDEILCMAHGVLGIGGTKIHNELKQYFPQLRHGKDDFLFQMIGEGIDTDFSYLPVDLKSILCNPELTHHLDAEKLQRPVILNVGRLNRIKAQDQLLIAFGESRLHQDFNLVLIGGDRKNPTEEEQIMLNFFDTYLENNPDLKGSFVHLDALSNEMIRSLENVLSSRTPGSLPNIFISSSKKEEFGLSILEALCEGWLLFAPTKGGVRSYLKNGSNGFLINTSNARTMINDIENILYHSNMNFEDLAKICQKGISTVKRRYSSRKIALNFLEFYKKVKETGIK